MIDLSFAVTGARPERHAAVPTLLFDLAIHERSGVPIDAILLRCQLRIEPNRRRHNAGEQQRLGDLFGAPERWSDTTQPFLWTHETLSIRRFRDYVTVDLPVQASFDLEVTAPRYLEALDDGEIPLLFLFSGTVFASQGTGPAMVTQIPWDRETRFRLPVATWREVMDAYHPGEQWLRLRRDTVEALGAYKAQRALPTWDDAIATLLGEMAVGGSEHGELEVEV